MKQQQLSLTRQGCIKQLQTTNINQVKKVVCLH